MAKKRKTNLSKSQFIQQILKLQEKYGYTDQYIIDNVKDRHGIELTSHLQTYGKWKSGERLPQNLQDAIIAFAKFYHVSTDYLLKENEPETPQIGSIQDATGLDVDAVRNIMRINTDYPSVMKMINTVFSNSSGEDITFFLNLYNQIYDDYKDNKANVPDSSYDLERMQQRFLRTQSAYNFISTVVQQSMTNDFDKRILQEEDENAYYHSKEYLNSLPNANDMDYDLAYDDATVQHFKVDRF